MPNLNEIGDRFIQALNEIRVTRPLETELLAREALALVRLRIQKQGGDENGADFGQYSDAVVPRWYFDKLMTSGSKKILERKGWFVSYKDAREARGFQTDTYDYTFTGRFFNELRATISGNDLSSTTAEIVGSDRSQNILDWQSEKIDKSILLLSVEELRIINDAYFERIDDIINKYL